LSVSPASLSVTATTQDPAPTATLTLTLSHPYAGDLYVFGDDQNTQCLTGLTPAGGTDRTMQVLVQFNAPSALGQGTYSDQVLLAVTTDSAGVQHIPGSPCLVPVTYEVTPPPPYGLTSINPSSGVAEGLAITLAVHGNRFSQASVIQWNGSPRPTTFLSATQLTAPISQADLAAPGQASVTVSDPGQGVTGSQTFTILPPAFGVHSLVPASTYQGAPGFTLTVNGAQFTSGSVVLWNGNPRSTTFVSASQVTAQIPAADLVSTGQPAVTVLNPPAQGGTANALPFTIASLDAVAFQLNPGHTGGIDFPAVSLPAAPAWSVTLGGQPSYALIAEGKVFVTFVRNGGTELVALDQASGAIAWGPVQVSYSNMGWWDGGNAAYDGGRIFVLAATSSGSILKAFDGGTGNQLWSVLPPNNDSRPDAAPTAANGSVFISCSQMLSSYQQSNGALNWSVWDYAQDTCPAVTPTGVYVAYCGIAACYGPVTGNLAWIDRQDFSGGGGGIPVVANGYVIAPDNFATYGGHLLIAGNGAVAGAYVADVPPAIGSTAGYFLQSGTLRAIRLEDGQVLWSFAGDGTLTTSPVRVNNYVFIGSASGMVYGLDAGTGSQAWSQNVGAGIPRGAYWGAEPPLSGLSAGQGLLVVPAGNTLTAFQLNP
jgi:outer membrane protein assembly factor BamB